MHSLFRHNLWHTYNDRMVSGSSCSGVISHEAYLLFFERQDGSTSSSEDGDAMVEEEEEAAKATAYVSEENGDEEW